MAFDIRWLMAELKVPSDHAKQSSAAKILTQLLSENAVPAPAVVMDLGCGEGDSVDFFRRLNPDVQWVGLDIEDSPEVRRRKRKDAQFHSFDGVHMPFDMDHFDLVYCTQVMEHVRRPRELLAEVGRVLKPDGWFVGSTSQLEPYHSYSYWNFTPYGFRQLMDEAGLELLAIRPGIDALTLLARTGLGKPKCFNRWWRTESPLNRLIGIVGRFLGKEQREINLAKLMLCGQFCFVGRKSRHDECH
jgi:SAM-dependent methyltransferase